MINLNICELLKHLLEMWARRHFTACIFYLKHGDLYSYLWKVTSILDPLMFNAVYHPNMMVRLFGSKGLLAKQETMGTQGEPQGKTVAKTVHFFILLNKGLQICFLHLPNWKWFHIPAFNNH